MTLWDEPAYIGQTGFEHPVELDRNFLEGMLDRSGAFRYGDFELTTGVGTRAIAVAGGRYSILGVENSQQGAYFVYNDAPITFLLAAGVGNPRFDTFILRVVDDQYGVISGVPRAEIEVVQGVAAGSPTPRADSDFNVGGGFYKPGAWVRLGDVRVNVGDTTIPGGQITNNRRTIRKSGGLYHVTNNTELTAVTDMTQGDLAYVRTTNRYFLWDGTRWHWPMPRGVVGGKRYNQGTGTFIGTNAGPAEFLPGMDSGAITLEANRRFRFTAKIRVLTASGGGTALHAKLRETNIAGQTRSQLRQAFGVSGSEATFEWQGTYVTGSSDETKTLVLTLTTSAGVVNSYHGSADEWVGIEAEDVGPALPNSVTIV